MSQSAYEASRARHRRAQHGRQLQLPPGIPGVREPLEALPVLIQDEAEAHVDDANGPNPSQLHHAIPWNEVQRFYDLGRIAERGSVSETELDPFGS